jgi:Tol biopolymer transport system component
MIAYVGIGFPVPIPAQVRGLAIFLYSPRLPLMVALLAGIYAMLRAEDAAKQRSVDWTRFAWVAIMIVAVAVNIHSTWAREDGVRKEFAYRLPIEQHGYLNAHPQSEAGELRYISFSLDGYQLVAAEASGHTANPVACTLDDNLSYAIGHGQLLVERATAPQSVVVTAANPTKPILQNAHNPMLSADGETLAYLRSDHGRGQLMTHSLHGSAGLPDRTLTPTALNVYEATYLSDFEYAFAASDGSQPPQIYLTDQTHTNASVGLGRSRYPALSPDGAWLAYSRLEGGAWNLWIRDQRTGVIRRVGEVPCNQIQPTWLADSKTILYSTDCGRSLWFTAIAQRRVIP